MVKIRINPKQIIREYAKDLEKRFRINKVILFGSAVTHKFSKNNDLDIIVLSNDFKKISFLKRLELLSQARSGESREVPMDIIGYTPAEFNKLSKESVVLKEAKQNGKVVWP